MRYHVEKPFNSTIHRFHAGDEIGPEHDLAPWAVTDLKERGFVKALKVDYDGMTKAELEALAVERHIEVEQGATKTDIIAALKSLDRREDALLVGNLDALLKDDLERLAVERGLDVSGAKTKADLVALLEAAESVEAEH